MDRIVGESDVLLDRIRTRICLLNMLTEISQVLRTLNGNGVRRTMVKLRRESSLKRLLRLSRMQGDNDGVDGAPMWSWSIIFKALDWSIPLQELAIDTGKSGGYAVRYLVS